MLILIIKGDVGKVKARRAILTTNRKARLPGR